MPKGVRQCHGCTAHCARCDLCFAGDSAFDAHCGGPKHDWDHLHPREVAKLEARPGGRCRLCSTVRDGRIIWGLAGSRERMAAVHGPAQ